MERWSKPMLAGLLGVTFSEINYYGTRKVTFELDGTPISDMIKSVSECNDLAARLGMLGYVMEEIAEV